MSDLIFSISMVLMILLPIVAFDLYEIHRYKKATICQGRVIRSLGTDTHHYRTGIEFYETYEVRFNYNGKEQTGEVYTYETGLHPGASIEVHLEDSDYGYEILTDKYCIKFNNLVLFLLLMTIIIVFLGLMIFIMTHI